MKRKHTQTNMYDFFSLPNIKTRRLKQIKPEKLNNFYNNIFPDLNIRIIDPREIVLDIEENNETLNPFFAEDDVEILRKKYENYKNFIIANKKNKKKDLIHSKIFFRNMCYFFFFNFLFITT